MKISNKKEVVKTHLFFTYYQQKDKTRRSEHEGSDVYFGEVQYVMLLEGAGMSKST